MSLTKAAKNNISIAILGVALGLVIYNFGYSPKNPSAVDETGNEGASEIYTDNADKTEPTSDVQAQSSNTSSQQAIAQANPSNDDPKIITHRFGGKLVRKIGSNFIDGDPVQLYEVQVDSSFLGKDALGTVPTIVIVAFNNVSTEDFSNNKNLMKFETHYYSEFGWHRVVHGWAVFVDYEYPADFSNDEVLVGASHNVFVGRVVKKVSEKDPSGYPETQFEVQVIENIKGDLNGNVTLNQQGGFKNGISYAVAYEPDEILKGGDSNYLLQIGSTYLFATRYYEKENWHSLNPHINARKLLSTDAGTDASTLKSLANEDGRVNQLKSAYENEILLEADVLQNNTLNNFQNRNTIATNPEVNLQTDVVEENVQ